jgi:hypothetical protein
VGYGTPTFQQGIQAILDVQDFFDQNIPANKLDECTIIEKCGEALGLHMTNRYCMPRRETTSETEVALTPDIDPSGILAGVAGDHFFHGKQNVMKYYNRRVVHGGAIK